MQIVLRARPLPSGMPEDKNLATDQSVRLQAFVQSKPCQSLVQLWLRVDQYRRTLSRWSALFVLSTSASSKKKKGWNVSCYFIPTEIGHSLLICFSCVYSGPTHDQLIAASERISRPQPEIKRCVFWARDHFRIPLGRNLYSVEICQSSFFSDNIFGDLGRVGTGHRNRVNSRWSSVSARMVWCQMFVKVATLDCGSDFIPY